MILETIACAPRTLVLAASFAAVVAAPGAASAAETAEGYVTNSDGEIYRDADGNCWHAADWSKELAIEECEPDLVAAKETTDLAAAEQPAESEPEPPAKTLKQITLNEDIWFGFDDANLSGDMRSLLDQVISKAADANKVLNVRLVGHADRIGPQDYNQALGERRARSVEDYLRGNAGSLAQAQITTESKGEQTSVVACDGKQGEALIKCLQPDRRVDIEVDAERETTQ